MSRRREVRRRRLLIAAAITLTLGSCGYRNPYHFPPYLSSIVRVRALETDVADNPTGIYQNTRVYGVRVWLIEGGNRVDSTLSFDGVGGFQVHRYHTYQLMAGVPPAYADTTRAFAPTQDVGTAMDTLKLDPSALLVIYPNPFPTVTNLRFSLGADQSVSLAIHDLAGKRVRLLAQRTFVAGSHVLLWDGTDDAAQPLPDGSYWAILSAPSGSGGALILKQSTIAAAPR